MDEKKPTSVAFFEADCAQPFDATGLVASCAERGTSALLLERDALSDEFFDLSTGFPSFQVVPADHSDAEAWLNLARQVEPLFGPMVDRGFDRAIRANIDRQTAFCVRNPERPLTLTGGLLFDDRDAPTYRVTWLAVDEPSRKKGIGQQLLRYALRSTVNPCVIEVVTFGPGHPGRRAAKRFYESFGFTPGPMRERGPEGGSRQSYMMRVRA